MRDRLQRNRLLTLPDGVGTYATDLQRPFSQVSLLRRPKAAEEAKPTPHFNATDFQRTPEGLETYAPQSQRSTVSTHPKIMVLSQGSWFIRKGVEKNRSRQSLIRNRVSFRPLFHTLPDGLGTYATDLLRPFSQGSLLRRPKKRNPPHTSTQRTFNAPPRG